MSAQTIGAMLQSRLQSTPEAVALRVRGGWGFVDRTWAELQVRLDAVVAGLLSLEPVVSERAVVAILGETSEDWLVCDYACQLIGLVTVPVYASLLADEVGYLLADCGASVVVVENRAQLDKVRAIREGFVFQDAEVPAERLRVQHVVVIDPTDCDGSDWISLDAVEDLGRERLLDTADERRERAGRPVADDLATITYTSGTTGLPKGVLQTHRNVLGMVRGVEASKLLDAPAREHGLFLFLPLAHSFGRLIEFAGPAFGSPVVVSSVPTLLDDLLLTRPGTFPSAPRVFEKMKAKLEGRLASASPLQQRLFAWALGVGRETVPYRERGEALPWWLQARFAVAHRLLFRRIHAALGLDRATVLLSGSAPLSEEVHAFFLALGLNLVEAYGLTETYAGLTTNVPHDFRLGTVGRPFPGSSVRIASDGEVLVKGVNVFEGYLGRESETQAAFTSDGWFKTGDLGSLDAEGFLTITGRKKELMKTSGGKYIAPVMLEARIKQLGLVQEAVVVADARNYVTALVSIDPEALAEHVERFGWGDEAEREVARLVATHLEQVNSTLARYETIKAWYQVPALTIESGLLTPSLKVKRGVVLERYAAEIDRMYTPGRTVSLYS